MARAGQFRERVRVERLSGSGPDRYGQSVQSWGTLATLWGDLRSLSGREGLEGGRLREAVSATLLIRHSALSAGITAADRVVARGHAWQIRAAYRLDNRGALVQLDLERGVAVGADLAGSLRVLAGDEAGNGRALAGDEAGNGRAAA